VRRDKTNATKKNMFEKSKRALVASHAKP
jgi:hypothetical protein